MVNLLNPELRVRDLRKLVAPYLHEVKWDRGVDETSEWVLASHEDNAHKSNLISWLNSKNISGTFEVIITDKAWSNLRYLNWSQLLFGLASYFDQENILIISSDRTWVMEYSPQQIVRFGQW
ncbi:MULTISPECIES: hypothetical protein [unclassified Colwellia]|jgi:hypothetical protein|uniref:hypothetical protein n=1 Tax=unclassified Colwellia TaxID=196834 RepID=UPI0015F4BE3C|nr:MULTISPECIES: hypothetical protein [unclassified Colwellia]MBA6231069.1 hypothetical protein [Colwellia sp. MB02u-7]MBA6234522.1 hypothetical protein [Colwellia sp. MB02u-11]MBA6297877.1 hypothetical protein [Colwellia sp. MB3u-22]MBA6309460.1 hypothetical protein [Colwellia sp. MB3u-64]